jgi:ATP-dependent protease ClpP protease subunit
MRARLPQALQNRQPADDRQWYRFENLGDDETDVILYGEIGWYGTEAETFVRELRALKTARINLRLSSPGGSVFDGIAIMNGLRAHSAEVTVYVDSLAASIASVIAMAGDRVVMMPASEMMIHEASGLCMGNAADMRELADLLDRQSDKIAAVYAERAGGDVEGWRAAMNAETWYSAEEAVAAGLADEVAELPRKGAGTEEGEEPQATGAQVWEQYLAAYRYAGRAAAPAPEPVATQPEPSPSAAEPTPAPEPSAPVEAPGVPFAPAADFMASFLAACATVGITPAAPTGTAPPAAPDPEPPPAADEPPVDEWAAAIAHLTEPAPADDWSAAIAHLTTPAPCSAATEA